MMKEKDKCAAYTLGHSLAACEESVRSAAGITRCYKRR